MRNSIALLGKTSKSDVAPRIKLWLKEGKMYLTTEKEKYKTYSAAYKDIFGNLSYRASQKSNRFKIGTTSDEYISAKREAIESSVEGDLAEY